MEVSLFSGFTRLCGFHADGLEGRSIDIFHIWRSFISVAHRVWVCMWTKLGSYFLYLKCISLATYGSGYVGRTVNCLFTNEKAGRTEPRSQRKPLEREFLLPRGSQHHAIPVKGLRSSTVWESGLAGWVLPQLPVVPFPRISAPKVMSP